MTLPAGLPAESYESQFSAMDDTTRLTCWNCGGSGGISQLAFSRGLSPGGNLDERSYVDLGNKDVQDAVMHYLDVCFVNLVILQLSCRTTGLASYCNSQVNHDTWHEPHIEDLPHIEFVVRFLYVRMIFDGFICEKNQWVLGWVRYYHGRHWPNSMGTCKVNMDQCTTGLRDSHGVVIRKPTEIMANHRLLPTPFERRRCARHHQHASVSRDPHHSRPYSSTVLVTSVRGYDLDNPTVPRQPDGSIARPPSGGLGCPACADNVNMRSPSHDRNPRRC
eukprot:4696402-Pyramimonas_sp.AAC.1